MATKAVLKVRTAFTDESYRDVELGPFDYTKITPAIAKSRIATFNQNISDIAGLYLSDDGSSCTGITAATLIVDQTEEINLND